MQVTATTAVCRAVTVTDEGCEHGSSCSLPLLTSMMSGERPESWYRPGGSRTEKVPEGPTRTVTRRCPAAVTVTDEGCEHGSS